MSTRAGKLAAALAAIVLGAFTGVAHADEIVAEEIIVGEEVIAPPAEAPPPEEPCCVVPPLGYLDTTFDDIVAWWAKPNRDLKISSGLSTSFQWDFNEPSNYKVPFRFNTTHSRYFVDLFQLSLGYRAEPEPGDFGGQIVFDAGRLARREKSDWNGSGVVPDTWWENKSAALQQAFAVYNVPIGNGLTLKGGKFVTLNGNEAIEPWANPTYSRSYLFTWAAPYTHTGGYATYPVTDMVSLTAGGVIGWDNVFDNNSAPAAIGEIMIDPSEYANLKVSGSFGPEQTCRPNPGVLPTLQGQGCDSNMRGLVDVVLNVDPVEDLHTSINFLWASEDEASLVNPGRHAQWLGATGTVWYDFLDCFTVATRGEWFQDQQGVRLGTTNAAGNPIGATVWAVTGDLKAMLSEHVYIRSEYRYDGSPQPIFTATNAAGQTGAWRGQNTVAVELGYSF
ncbi:MAG: outer membrane beta-barrel protein [Candidatus Binatia bacterium]|nr:outer membrane beta-barrel protein [Candidatus Binatia bacterium]